MAKWLWITKHISRLCRLCSPFGSMGHREGKRLLEVIKISSGSSGDKLEQGQWVRRLRMSEYS